MDRRKNKALNIAIIIVSVLLALSLLALGSTLFYNFVLLGDKAPETVVVPQNYIKALSEQNEPSESVDEPETQEDTTLPEWVASRLEEKEPDTGADTVNETEPTESVQTTDAESDALISEAFDETDAQESEQITEDAVVSEAHEPEIEEQKDVGQYSYKAQAVTTAAPRQKLVADNRSGNGTGTAAQTKNTNAPEATVVRLSYRDPNINQRFKVENMFPGDEETKYYCARVQFIDKATLYFEVNVRPGYKKLAEVLEIRVFQINDGKLLYEGLIGDVPEIKAIELDGNGKTTTDVFYAITVSLDTSVGNEYMQKELLADFHWWFEGESGGGGDDGEGGGGSGGGGGGGGGDVPDNPDFPGPIIGPAETDDEDETTKADETTKDSESEKDSDTVSESDTGETETIEDDTSRDDSGDVTDDTDETSDDADDTDADETTARDDGEGVVDSDSGDDSSQETKGDGSDDYVPDGPPASQTGDENIVRIKIATYAALSALWLLLLLLFLRLKDDEDKQKQS
ncbi:MAG: hypothetical protein IJD67_03245 [Clostridia bacterium]|nr:hypothetical protein [Clostridia bacterium]